MSKTNAGAEGHKWIATVEELVEHIELTGLRAFEISGKRADPAPGATLPEPREDSHPVAAAVAMEIMESHTSDSIQTRFRAIVQHDDGDYVADFGLSYTFSEPLSLSEEAVHGLLSRVAVMSAWPFIREAVASTAARMELEVPILGLVKQGQFELTRVQGVGESPDQ